MLRERPRILPNVSVVIPCWNAERWVSRAIQSVIDQAYPNLEIIVIDDGSTDRTFEVIQSFGDRILYETIPNGGGCAARNRGLERSSAEFVLFLDADDYVEGPLIEGLASTAQRSELDLAVGVSESERDGTRVQRHAHSIESSRDDLLGFWLTGRYVQTAALIWRSEFLRSIGGWNVRVRRSQDIELVMRSILSGAKIAATNHGTAVWCDHSSPSRVGQNHSESALASEYDFHLCLLKMFPELEGRWTKETANRFYSIALEAYWYGCHDLGSSALIQARKLGLRGHAGTFPHKILCGILGLQKKQQLSRWARTFGR